MGTVLLHGVDVICTGCWPDQWENSQYKFSNPSPDFISEYLILGCYSNAMDYRTAWICEFSNLATIKANTHHISYYLRLQVRHWKAYTEGMYLIMEIGLGWKSI